MKEFSLFIGFTGPGYTYCDKTVCKNGEYKKLAFVDAYTGKITWYVPQCRVPGYVQMRIEYDSEKIVRKAG